MSLQPLEEPGAVFLFHVHALGSVGLFCGSLKIKTLNFNKAWNKPK